MTWDQYRHQKAEVKLGTMVQLSESILESDETLEHVVKMLAESTTRAARLQGYKVDGDKQLFVHEAGIGLSPLDTHGSVGAKVRAVLAATPDKYLAYAQEQMHKLANTLESRSEWLGFLRWRLRADTIDDIEAGRDLRLDRLGDELSAMADAIRKLQKEDEGGETEG